MRLPLVSLVALSVFGTASCEMFKKQDASANANDPYGQNADPYGQVPGSNPYGQTAPPNPYTQQAAPNPYGSYEPAQTYTAPPPQTYSPAPSYSGGGGGGGGSVTVQKGDTLTAIARRNGTSISALKSANGLNSDLIRIGQTLRLP